MPLSCGDGELVSLSSLLEAIPQTVLAQVDTAAHPCQMHFLRQQQQQELHAVINCGGEQSAAV